MNFKQLKYEDYSIPYLPFHAANYIYNASTPVTPHYHNFYEFFLIRSGSIIQNINGSSTKIDSFSLYFILPGDKHSFKNTQDASANLTNIAFSAETYGRLVGDLELDALSELSTDKRLIKQIDSYRWEVIIKKANALLNQKQIASKKLKFAIFNSILLDVIMLFMEEKAVTKNIPNWLSSACSRMQEKANYLLGLRRFIELSTKTQEHLSRELRKYYGVTPTAYINDIRLEESALLLLNTDMSITDICFEVGFENIPYFLTLFKKRYDLSPSKYRNQNSELLLATKVKA